MRLSRLRLPLAHFVCLMGLATAVPAIEAVVAPLPAEARAGGSYGSSGGYHGYSGPRGTSGTTYTYGAGHHPGESEGGAGGLKGLLIAFGLFGLFAVMSFGSALKGRQSAVTPASTKPRPSRSAQRLDELMAQAAAQDPIWREDDLLAHAREAFHAVQLAWARRDQEPARPHMAEGFYRRHKGMTDGMIARGERNVLEKLELLSAKVVHAADFLDDSKDEVWVKFRARAVDYLISERTGQVLEGAKGELSVFTEVWRFRRQAGAWRVVEIKDGNPAIPRSFSEAETAKTEVAA